MRSEPRSEEAGNGFGRKEATPKVGKKATASVLPKENVEQESVVSSQTMVNMICVLILWATTRGSWGWVKPILPTGAGPHVLVVDLAGPDNWGESLQSTRDVQSGSTCCTSFATIMEVDDRGVPQQSTSLPTPSCQLS